MKILVLGGSGFIGSALVKALCLKGNAVTSLAKTSRHTIGHDESVAEARVIVGDFADKSTLQRALDGVSVCVHLISTTVPSTSNFDCAYDIQSNVCSTIGVLETAVKLGLRKIVFVSSGGTVYGRPNVVPIPEQHPCDPVCSYGIGKLAIEKYLSIFKQLHGLDYTVLRLANPYGPNQYMTRFPGAVSTFVHKVQNDEPIEIWGDGTIVRDYLFIDDAVAAIESVVSEEGSGEVFNVGSGGGHALTQVISLIEHVTEKRATCRYLPGRGFDVPSNVLDISKARDLLGWVPRVNLEAGIRRMLGQ